MQKYILKIFYLLSFALLFQSCSTTKSLKGEEKLLVRNQFKYKDKRIFGAITLNEYVKQRPNSKFLIFPLRLYYYNMVNDDLKEVYKVYFEFPKKERNQKLLDSLYAQYGEEKYVGKSKWLDRFLYKNSQPPIIVNEKYTKQTTTTLQNFFIKKGYRHAKVSYEIKKVKSLCHPDKKRKVVYEIDAGEPSRISAYTKEFEIPEVLPVVEEYEKNSKVEVGEILDEYKLQNDVNYYQSALRNNGYYKFNSTKENIILKSDAYDDAYEVPITMLFTSGNDSITSIQKNYIGKIKTTLATPEQSQLKNCGDVENEQEALCNRFYNKKGLQFIKDTLIHLRTEMGKTDFEKNKEKIVEGLYHYLDKNGSKRRFTYFKDKVLQYPQIISPGDLYRENDVSDTKRNYYILDNFNLQKVVESESPDENGNIDYVFQLTPKKRQRLEILTELSYSEILRVGTTVGVESFRRNVFRGAENLTTSLSATLGTVSNSETETSNRFFNAYDLSLQMELKFPKWIFFSDNLFRKLKRSTPTSSINAGISRQNNIGLGRMNYNTQLSYFLQPNSLNTHKLSIFNTQYTRYLNPENYYQGRVKDQQNINAFIYGNDQSPGYVNYNPEAQEWLDSGLYDNYSLVDYIFNSDTSYLEYLKSNDPELRDRMRYIYRNKSINTQNLFINSLLYRYTFNQNTDALIDNPWNISIKLELAGLFLGLIDGNKEVGNHEILGVKYSEFFSVEADIRKQILLREKTRIAMRFFAGLGLPFGNSENLPYDRNYIAGGSTDMRGWRPFGLGPGDSKEDFSLGGFDNLKLLTSVEYRFPISTAIEGAFFSDIGNVWGTNKDYEYTFKFKEFYKQVGIDGGFGLRYNIGFFLIRADWAWRLYDPKYDEKDRWGFDRLFQWPDGFQETRLVLGLSYPF